MKKQIVMFILLLAPFSLFAGHVSNTNYVTKEEFRSENNHVKGVISSLNEKVLVIENIVSTSTASIANQLSAASTNMTVFGVLLGLFGVVAGVFLSLYVSKIERRVISLLDENRRILNDTKDIQSNLNNINNLMQHDIKGLYEKLKNEETEYMIERLVTVPEDILNLFPLLASRVLPVSVYEKLKKAFMAIDLSVPEADRAIGVFAAIFFQHYPSKIFLDNDLYPRCIKPNLSDCLRSCFKSELISITKQVLVDLNHHSRFDEFLSDFLIATQVLGDEYRELVLQEVRDATEVFGDDLKEKVKEMVSAIYPN